ncbi:hypothetical protein EKK70_10855 [Desulfovibrio sp. DS-1]|nr:hypothetical protein [Nitratidesulfovibrio sp. SRB-5]RXF76639.1 hypothetical protein EKK70_10855 [Desulfovibrio sp. DS-1]
MVFDYLSAFPVPANALPSRLKELLTPVGMSFNQRVEVASLFEEDPYGNHTEYLHLLMAVVPGVRSRPIGVLSEASAGVVQGSVPDIGRRGGMRRFVPSASGYDYIVASCGNGSFYTFSLAEKVWMALGLTPRCLGNDQQRLIYDDLALPEVGVADGVVASDFQWNLKKNVTWKISNEYLRRYLWMRGARGVRIFYYKAQLVDSPELRALMNGQSQVVLKPQNEIDWYELDIREHRQGLLLQVWASVEAVMPELCPEQTAQGILWPGYDQPMTRKIANAMINDDRFVYLKDSFLERYEQNSFYDSTPFFSYENCDCSPSYRGQWSFTECRRIGRNLIRVPMRELYKAKPDREIVHARSFAIDPADVVNIDLSEEHIASKIKRFLDVLLRLADALAALGKYVGINKTPKDLIGFDREEITANGWRSYPVLSRLAQVAPVDMSQQMFLARCKTIHELYQSIPNGYLKKLLVKAGCPKSDIESRRSIKLLQALLNIVALLNEQDESCDAFESKQERVCWRTDNAIMAPLFLNNDLRIADAHEAADKCLMALERMGFDVAGVSAGYGKALDFVVDRVIFSLNTMCCAIESLLLSE